MQTLQVDVGHTSYPIRIGAGLLGDAALFESLIAGKDVGVVTNTTVAALYLEKLRTALAGLRIAECVLPDGDLAEEAFGVLRDALRATGKMGLGQFVMRGREYVVALKPCGAGMMLETLRFSDEVRDAAPFFADVSDEKPNKELLDLAKELIGRKSRRFEPGQFHDHYTEALRALIEAKAKNRPVEVDEDDGGNRGNVIDLVEALRRSVRENEAAKPAARAKAVAKPKAAAPPKRARAR